LRTNAEDSLSRLCNEHGSRQRHDSTPSTS
jgi:hypothetical protein